MEAITWIERITDETNPWLIAIKKEGEGNLLQAFTLYLEDACECLRQGAPVKAALSCSCAAECLVKMGRLIDAQVLVSETARIYLGNADSVIGKSVREALWSLREAYEYFQLANDTLAAREVYGRLISLSSRVDPKVGSGALTQSPPPKSLMFGVPSAYKAVKINDSPLIAESIQQFLRLRRSRDVLETRPARSEGAVAIGKRVQINEESIISQLG